VARDRPFDDLAHTWWDRLLRPGDLRCFIASSGIRPVRTVGVSLPLRGFPRALIAIIGLLVGRLTHPEAALRIPLAPSTHTLFAYQGYGIRDAP
jgi:hypothetical protein